MTDEVEKTRRQWRRGIDLSLVEMHLPDLGTPVRPLGKPLVASFPSQTRQKHLILHFEVEERRNMHTTVPATHGS